MSSAKEHFSSADLLTRLLQSLIGSFYSSLSDKNNDESYLSLPMF